VEALKLGRRARPPTPDAFRGQADPNGVISCEDFSCSDRVSQGEINKITSLEKSQTAVSFDHIHLGSNCCVVLPDSLYVSRRFVCIAITRFDQQAWCTGGKAER
jgi:hypothetical protein